MIKKIHYIWVGGKKKPRIVRKCIAGWKKIMPGWEIIEWNESNLNLDLCDFCKEAYERKKYAFVADVMRFFILSEHGGLYLDTDVKVIRNLEPLLEKYDAAVGYEFQMINPGLVLYSNTPHNEVIDNVLFVYKHEHFIDNNENENLKVVGQYMSEVLENYGFVYEDKHQQCGSFHVFPSTFFCPTDAYGNMINYSDNTYTQHLNAGSWMNSQARIKNSFKRIVYKIFGLKRIQIITKTYRNWLSKKK